MRHVLDAQQFEPDWLQLLFDRTAELQKLADDPKRYQKTGQLLAGRLMFTLFYEPSTRTRLSFSAAGQHLGMQVVSTENAREFSSAAKGETIEDTFKVLCGYRPDVIVMRHHETGAAARAAAVSTVPVINAGDGTGQHPTQSLLDLYTIHQEVGRTRDLCVVLGGDLLHGRTARSLAVVLAKYPGNRLILVSPGSLRLGDDVKAILREQKLPIEESTNLAASLKQADVVYWTRIQKERFDSSGLTESYVITPKEMKHMKKDAVLMHPLPRVDEISADVDDDPRAAYFRQAANGMYIRMALLEWALGLL